MNTIFLRHIVVGRLPGALCAFLLVAQPAFADDSGTAAPVRADSHAPIGVMAEHMHKTGEWMVSYRFMRMDMDGNRIDDDRVSPDFIATTVPNRFAGLPGQPPTLRIVPLDMTMDMHMVGAMYAPANWVTLMGMAQYVSKEMDHRTYQGGAGTTVLGDFRTKSDGLGDTTLGAMFRVYDAGAHHVHLNFGVSLPTGDIDETAEILTPMDMRPTVRMPYAMQLGSGTYDLLPGVTYTGRMDQFTWGAQYMGTIRLDENDEDYTLGDLHRVTGWVAYSPMPWISWSLRLAFETLSDIDGIDPQIVGPVQTADPDNYGGERVDAYIGVNLAGQTGWQRGHRLTLEAGWPLDQDLNGPQLETDFRVITGWQYAF